MKVDEEQLINFIKSNIAGIDRILKLSEEAEIGQYFVKHYFAGIAVGYESILDVIQNGIEECWDKNIKHED